MDDDWITINGTHVMVDDEGKVEKGPSSLKNVKDVPKSLSKNVKVSTEMKPNREDYEYESGDDRNDWVHKNVKKLQALYDEGGSKAIDDEWYKFRMADSTKDIHQMSKDEADEAVYDCPYLTQSLYDGWFRNADSSYKPKLTDAIVSSPEMRSAAMSLAYENYRNNIDEPMSFRRFLTTPIKVYRGERGQKHIKDDVFDAYTFDRKMAEHFSGPNGTIIETEVRPIDTFGSMRAVGEAEIWIPRNLSPVKRTDGVDARRIGDWEWKDPVKWAFEDYAESGISETDFSINEDALDSIIRDCEMIELFLSSKSESDKKIAPDVVDRCIDSIQRSVKQMTAFQKAENEDGAFFEGELDSDLGEKEKLYPDGVGFNMDSAWDEWLEEHLEDFESDDEQIKFRDGEWGGFKPKDASAVEEVDSAWDAYKKKKRVDRFRERRQKRLDAKEEPAAWITVNGNHIPVDEEGNPVGGQKKALGAQIGSSAKRDFGSRLSGILRSSESGEIKIGRIKELIDGFPKNTRVDFPDSWTSDDGTKNYGIYEGEGKWRVRYGRGKNDTLLMGSEELAGYFNDENESERPKVTKIPGEKKEKPGKVNGVEKFKHDGSVIDNHIADFHNPHVSQEDRDWWKDNISTHIESGRRQFGFDDRRAFFSAGQELRDEIKRRHGLRVKDPEDAVDRDSDPEVEDVYDVLRDCRPFGKPDGFDKIKAWSEIDDKRTQEIIGEAERMFPTDWYEQAENGDLTICIHDMPGRAHFNHGWGSQPNVIHIYTKNGEDLTKLGIEENKPDRMLVNELVHEMGHYMEYVVPKVGAVARKCLEDRTAGGVEEPLEEGYTTKVDKFFRNYMGKQYWTGSTEITSCMMQELGSSSPLDTLSGKTILADRKDPESLKYILGVLGGL